MKELTNRPSINRLAAMSEGVRARMQISTWDAEDFSVVIRWGFTIVGVVGSWVQDSSLAVGPRNHVAVGVVIYAVLRTFLRVPAAARRSVTVSASIADLSVYGCGACLTGVWSSPYMVCVAGSVALAGLVAGLAAVMVGIVEIAAFRSVRMYLGVSTLGSGTVLYKVLGIFAIGVLGACAGQLLRIQKMRAGELKSLRSLNEVHSLLLELHTRAEDEPRWLTLNGATRTIVGRLRNEIQADLVTLLLRDPSVEGLEQHWQVAAVEGLRLPPMMVDKRLPGGARQAERQRGVIRVAELRPGQGLDSRSTSGLYAPLWGRSALLGILILERRSDAPFTEYDAEVVDGIARHAGLTIDNTRLFARLRRLGADVERDRIARELHDRIGQSLVGVGLTVDRLAMSLPEEAQEVRRELESVAADVRGVTRQVREKLTDLRTDPASTTELPRALGEFLDRVAARSQIRITFDQNPVRDLTETEAHEVWRIAQEAVLNAERHAGAGHLYIFWGEKNRQRLLIVSDDGKGITGTAPLRRDAYGLIGMRERAEVIGASLILDTGAGKGTTVRLRLKEAKA